jgi:hypothetical protein
VDTKWRCDNVPVIKNVTVIGRYGADLWNGEEMAKMFTYHGRKDRGCLRKSHLHHQGLKRSRRRAEVIVSCF